MDQKIIFWTITGMAVVTYLPRFLPFLFLSGRQLHPLVTAWLKLVPPAVLSALLVPSLIVRESQLDFSFSNIFFWAAMIAFPVAWKSKSLSATVVVGMGFVALGRYLGWGM